MNTPISDSEASLASLRREYCRAGLSEAEILADPLEQFKKWFAEAQAANIAEPNAMVLATVDLHGQPSTRVVLLKGIDSGGFSFFTNYESRKGRELSANPRASITFPWIELERQVCVQGTVTRLSREKSADYFKVRPRASRLGAWASPQQSEVVESRAVLEKRMQEMEGRYTTDDVPLPPYWGGFVLSPNEIEFWQGRPSRLHDRLRYARLENSWKLERLSP